MSDDLIYAMFKELAIVEGKRKPDGTWVDTTPGDLQRLLSRAFGMVNRAATSVTREDTDVTKKEKG
jgi:hypothetical protein